MALLQHGVDLTVIALWLGTNRLKQLRFTCMQTCSSRSAHLLMPTHLASSLIGIARQIACSPFSRVSDYADCICPGHPCFLTKTRNIGIIQKSAFCGRENPEESNIEPEEQLLL